MPDRNLTKQETENILSRDNAIGYTKVQSLRWLGHVKRKIWRLCYENDCIENRGSPKTRCGKK